MKYLKLSISKNFSMNFFWKLLKGNEIENNGNETKSGL